MGLALVRDGPADAVRVEDPAVRAGLADAVVPGLAAGVGDGLGRNHLADSVVEGESAVAACAGSVCVAGGAEGRDLGADSVGVEEPEGRALGAGLGVPVPDLAAEHGGALGVRGRENALVVGEVVALPAAGAGARGVVGPAGVVHGDADVVRVEDPSVRAGLAYSVVPGLAPGVRGSGSVGRRKFTISIDEIISLIASQAKSINVMSPADIANRNTSSIVVHDPSG